MSLKEWFKRTFPDEPLPRAERRSVPGLEALHWTGKNPGLDNVKDISSSGIYIQTKERWTEGEVNPIRLTAEDAAPDDPDRDVEVNAKAVRWGEDGMGLTFVLPEKMDVWLWRTNNLAEAAEVVREFRVAKALAYLKELCPSAENELDLLFREGMSNLRVQHAVAITFRAEEMLAEDKKSRHVRIPKELLLKMIETGSWTDSELTEGMWAGLFAVACRSRGKDESILELIETMSQLATMHSRILHVACTRSTKKVAENGTLQAETQIFTATELTEIADAHDLLRIDRNLTQLSDLNLIEPRVKSKYFTQNDPANVTPTPHGLLMFARCHGHMGPVSEFYRTATPDAPVASN